MPPTKPAHGAEAFELLANFQPERDFRVTVERFRILWSVDNATQALPCFL